MRLFRDGVPTPSNGIWPQTNGCCLCGWPTWISARPRPYSTPWNDGSATGVFGYTKVPDAYFEAVKGWFGKRYGFRIENEWILPTTGVIPALSVILKALTEPGDKVILQTPVYNCFFAVLERTGRQPLANPLINENGAYRMDFEDLERKAADPPGQTDLPVQPPQPGGPGLDRRRADTPREDLPAARGNGHIGRNPLQPDARRPSPHSVASLNEEFLRHSVTCTAPSKTFNIAGRKQPTSSPPIPRYAGKSTGNSSITNSTH